MNSSTFKFFKPMKPSSTSLFLICIILNLLFSGCGSFTKMRYSKGLKSNIEFNFGKKDGQEERYIAAKAIKKQSSKTTTDYQNTFYAENISLEVPSFIQQAKEENNLKKKNMSTPLYTKVISKVKNATPLNLKKDKRVENKAPRNPMEPNTKTGAILFYSGIVSFLTLFIILIFSWYVPPIYAAFLLVTIACALAGFILSAIGLQKIQESGKPYRGEGLAKSVIITGIILFLLIILAFAL